MATRRLEQAERTKVAPVRGADASGTFTLDEVKALVEVLEGTDVTSLRWDRNGQKIVIRRGQVPAAPQPAPQVAHAAPAPPPKPEAKPGVVVTSPFVGTFYRSPSPDSPPFVEMGTVVKKGQVLC